MESLLLDLSSIFSAKLPRITNEASFYFRPDPVTDDTLNCYSLLCPLSLQLQKIPVRTNCCQHVHTVDLLGLFRSWTKTELISFYAKFKLSTKVNILQNCPICKARGSLYVDATLENFITSNPTVENISFNETGKAVAITSLRDKTDHVNIKSLLANSSNDEVKFHWQHFGNSPDVWSMGEISRQTSVAQKMEKAMLTVQCVEAMTSPRSPCLWWESQPLKSPSLWWESQATSPHSVSLATSSTFSERNPTSQTVPILTRRRHSTIDILSPNEL